MALKQTRRSISISLPVYVRFKAHCEAHGVPMSQLVEALINERLDGSLSGVKLSSPERARFLAADIQARTRGGGR